VIEGLVKRAGEKNQRGRRWPMRGVLSLLRWAKVPLCQFRGLKGERFQKVEMFQHFGFRSRPIEGAEVVLAPVGGSGAHVFSVAEEDRRYPCPVELKPGEVCVYDAQGNCVVIATGRMTLYHQTKIVMAAPNMEFYYDDMEQPDFQDFPGLEDES